MNVISFSYPDLIEECGAEVAHGLTKVIGHTFQRATIIFEKDELCRHLAQNFPEEPPVFSIIDPELQPKSLTNIPDFEIRVPNSGEILEVPVRIGQRPTAARGSVAYRFSVLIAAHKLYHLVFGAAGDANLDQVIRHAETHLGDDSTLIPRAVHFDVTHGAIGGWLKAGLRFLPHGDDRVTRRGEIIGVIVLNHRPSPFVLEHKYLTDLAEWLPTKAVFEQELQDALNHDFRRWGMDVNRIDFGEGVEYTRPGTAVSSKLIHRYF